MKIAKEAKVGLLAAVAIAMFVIGYNYLRGRDVFTSTNNYYGVYKKIDGLFKSNPVLVNGYKVGSVTDVMMDNETLLLTVEITVPQTIKIPLNSRMRITNYDMIGSKAIEIVFGDSSVLAESGDYLQSEQDPGIAQAMTEVLTPLTQRVNSVLGQIDTAIYGADLTTPLLDASLALKAFKETADRFNQMLKGKDEKMNRIFNNVETVSADLKKITPKLDRIVTQLGKTTTELEQVDLKESVDKINILVAQLTQTTRAINEGKGTLGKLATDDEVYIKLEEALTQLKQLLIDIEKYPRRYTGVSEKQRKKGDKQKAEGKE